MKKHENYLKTQPATLQPLIPFPTLPFKLIFLRILSSFFEEGATAPPPFNIIATPKSVMYFLQWIRRKFFGQSKAIKKEHMKTIRVSDAIIYDYSCNKFSFIALNDP